MNYVVIGSSPLKHTDEKMKIEIVCQCLKITKKCFPLNENGRKETEPMLEKEHLNLFFFLLKHFTKLKLVQAFHFKYIQSVNF